LEKKADDMMQARHRHFMKLHSKMTYYEQVAEDLKQKQARVNETKMQ
jgi:hypothetical protein